MTRRKLLTVAAASLVGGGTLLNANSAEAAATTTVRYGSRTGLEREVQALLAKHRDVNGVPFYTTVVDGNFGTGSCNALLGFQRRYGLTDDAIVGSATWGMLRRTTLPAAPVGVPAGCPKSGTVFCVSIGQRTGWLVKNGVVERTFRVRTGGWTQDSTGRLRVHRTGLGTFRVYNKDPNPSSARYGEGVMRNSVMFDPNMYIHNSDDFRAYGYTRGSHGCVNIGNLADSAWIYANMKVGDQVYITR